MTRPFALEAIGSNDAATHGPVRARRGKIIGAIGRLATTACLATLLAGFTAAAQRTGTLDIGSVTRAVEAHFASLPDYQPGDLITRSQIERVLTKLIDAGAPVPGADKIAERGLADNSFIVTQLASEDGQRFMRRLARTPGAFAHLDRLSSISRGEQMVRDLIHDKGGDKLIEYMATTKGGQKLGSMMTAVPDGTDLNKPTGRIYTVADLVAGQSGLHCSIALAGVAWRRRRGVGM